MASPHVAQALAPLNAGLGYRSAQDVPLHRVLRADAPAARYRRRNGEAKTVVHWGQRKLLLAEIEFITAHLPRAGGIVLYAGAAPGTHIRMLARLFEQLRFVLVDPAPFSIKARSNVTILQRCFDSALAAQYAGRRDVLFICDVRSVDVERCSAEEMERRCALDMAAQQQWHAIIRPRRSLLKFRLPYAAGATRYLSGELWIQPWGPPTTTEVRLVPDAFLERTARERGDAPTVTAAPPPPSAPSSAEPFAETRALRRPAEGGGVARERLGDGVGFGFGVGVDLEAKMAVYDHTGHGERMMHFNTATRVARYASPLIDSVPRDQRGGLDYCFDCVSEVGILRNYLVTVTGFEGGAAALAAATVALSRQVSRECSGGTGRTLASASIDPRDRRRGIRRRGGGWKDEYSRGDVAPPGEMEGACGRRGAHGREERKRRRKR